MPGSTGKKVGKNCSIMIGTGNVLGMGKWSIPGAKADMLDSTEFGDQWKEYMIGLQDGGEITFSGVLVATDTVGQQALMSANMLNSQITNMAFMIDSTSAFKLNLTEFPNSYLLVTAWKVDADKSNLVQVDFTMRVSGGPMMLQ